jgi:hypothetical protein
MIINKREYEIGRAPAHSSREDGSESILGMGARREFDRSPLSCVELWDASSDIMEFQKACTTCTALQAFTALFHAAFLISVSPGNLAAHKMYTRSQQACNVIFTALREGNFP